MAPAAKSDPKPIELDIHFPNEMAQAGAGTIKFTAEDFNLTWLHFLAKYKPRLQKMLQSQKTTYVLADVRTPDARQIWSLESLVKDFINGFQKTRKRYVAQITKRTSKMNVKTGSHQVQTPPARPPAQAGPPRATPAASNRNRAGPTGNSRAVTNGTKRPAPRSGNASESTLTVKFPRPDQQELRIPSSGAPNPNARRGPGPGPALNFMNIERDDIASQAMSIDSQDSQMDDLHDLGIENQNIKPEVMRNIHIEVNNATMLRIRHELQCVMDSGKWLKFTHRVPVTANALQLIFKLVKSSR